MRILSLVSGIVYSTLDATHRGLEALSSLGSQKLTQQRFLAFLTSNSRFVPLYEFHFAFPISCTFYSYFLAKFSLVSFTLLILLTPPQVLNNNIATPLANTLRSEKNEIQQCGLFTFLPRTLHLHRLFHFHRLIKDNNILVFEIDYLHPVVYGS